MVTTKRLDSRIHHIIENAVKSSHRGLFVLVGDKSRDQVVILHHLLTKSSAGPRPSVLWCYKKDLGFTTHRKKRMKMIKKKIKAGTLDPNTTDTFEMFISSTEIRYLYYHESHNILGNTFGMCILQDFEAVNPNVLARTIETVQGGGLVVILLNNISDIKQFYNLHMDCHTHYTTSAYHEVVPRFNKRFLLSLTDCNSCLVLSDELDVLPITKTTVTKVAATTHSEEAEKLKDLQQSFHDVQPVGSVINICKTLDQANALVKFVDVISEKTLKSIMTLTSGRGRGKSAALGMAIATAVSFGYTNIFVTSPSPENLKTLFEFVCKGFDVLGYTEHSDYEIIQSTTEPKCVVRVNIFRDHRQTIQYIRPEEGGKLIQGELLVIDEAGAIPLPYVKSLMGPYLVLISSTIHGYEGTGRSLSLKLIHQLRQQSQTIGGVELNEMKLEEPIRYKPNDPVESWLNKLLCLDSTNVHRIISGCPKPEQCSLYFVNRDVLFSYHRASELFLQRLWSLYVSSHYKNTPNDLQLLADAPAHQVLVLLGPFDKDSSKLPEVLCVLQVCFEGAINKEIVQEELRRGHRSAGDLIPWTISQQYQDANFGALSGLRIVRIATHPDFQSMGYGKYAIQQLQDYYRGKFSNISTETKSSDNSVLLVNLSDRPPESIQYFGVSYGLTSQLLKFWKRLEFTTVYLRQTTNDITGEHTCIMLNVINPPQQFLTLYHSDFKARIISLLGFEFRKLPASLVLSLFKESAEKKVLSLQELEYHITKYDFRRLQSYSDNLADHHLILDLVPVLARLYFKDNVSVTLSPLQASVLLALGLQYKTVDDVKTMFPSLEIGQVMGIFKKIIKRFVIYLEEMFKENLLQGNLSTSKTLKPLSKSLAEELESAEKEIRLQQEADRKKMDLDNLNEYAIKSSSENWKDALDDVKIGSNTVLSVKRKIESKPDDVDKRTKKKKKTKVKSKVK